MNEEQIKAFLDSKAGFYNRPSFIKDDPISVPHRYTKLQDIEISGLFAAIFSWGNRKTIIGKSLELMTLMNEAPFDFIKDHTDKDLKKLLGFRHRTFNSTDLLYFIEFLHHHYSRHHSLESAFTINMDAGALTMEQGILGFYDYFFSLPDHPERTRKHISSPAKGSSCKRLNMFLRWMVRRDGHGVDFGIWKKISPAQLLCPVDVHVARIATQLGILKPGPVNWKTTIALTDYLRKLDVNDPVRYDFALFGTGVMEKNDPLL